MKFLIDECLSPELATLARERGFGGSTHVTWLGLGGRPDWDIARRAVDDGYIFVTNNKRDFLALYQRENPTRPGLPVPSGRKFNAVGEADAAQTERETQGLTRDRLPSGGQSGLALVFIG